MAKLMGADAEYIMGSRKMESSGLPYIEGDHVVVDGINVCVFQTPDDLIEKIVCLTLTFSVLNVRFPRKNNAFLTYVQLHMLGIDDGARVPTKTLSFHSQTAGFM